MAASGQEGCARPPPLLVHTSHGTASIEVLPNGDVCITPVEAPGGPCACLSGGSLKAQTLPAPQLLGARLEGTPSCFSIWYATEHEERHGAVTRLLYKLRHTRTFKADSAVAVDDFITHIRRASSWWGRSRPPHIQVVINPFSGQGKSKELAFGVLLPLLREVAGMRVTEHLTTGPMHAAQLVEDMELWEGREPGPGAAAGAAGESGDGGQRGVAGGGEGGGVDLIAFCGGDGTLYEGLQGLMRRPDWSSAVRVPLAPVPTGSGNGLAASAGLWDVATAAVALCRGRDQPIDVASVLQPPASRSYCLLSVVYGVMSNLDIGTEHLRWMGPIRFHIGGVWELIKGRYYRCRVHALPPEAADKLLANAAQGADQLQGPAAPVAAVAGGGQANPLASHQGAGDVKSSNGGASAGGSGRQLLEGCPEPGVAHSISSRLPDYPPGPPLPILSRLPFLPGPLPDTCRPLPEGWVQVSDSNSFGVLGAYNTPFIATNGHLNPGGSMNDGAWDIWYLEAESKGAPGRGQEPQPADRASLRGRAPYLKLLLGAEDGSFAMGAEGSCPLKHMRARAIMLEQDDSRSTTVLDGEVALPVPLYLEVHPQLGRLCVSPRLAERAN